VREVSVIARIGAGDKRNDAIGERLFHIRARKNMFQLTIMKIISVVINAAKLVIIVIAVASFLFREHFFAIIMDVPMQNEINEISKMIMTAPL
jgi:hypothetical protein